MINYSEFLAATIDVHNVLTESRLQAIFNQFDTDSSGSLSRENIFLAMQKLGRQIEREEIEQIFAKHDLNHDGCLTYAEFKAIFFDGRDKSLFANAASEDSTLN